MLLVILFNLSKDFFGNIFILTNINHGFNKIRVFRLSVIYNFCRIDT